MTDKTERFYLVSESQILKGVALTGCLLVRDDEIDDWLAECRKVEVPEYALMDVFKWSLFAEDY